MSLKSSNYLELIKKAIKSFKLDLTGYNILIPPSPVEPAIFAVISSIAGARNVYVKTNKLFLKNNILKNAEELNLENIKCIDDSQIGSLCGLDIVIKSGELNQINDAVLNQLGHNRVISLFPEDLDFNSTDGIDIEAVNKKKFIL